MSGRNDHRLDEAKAMPIEEVASRLGIEGLRRMSGELVGPCPVCGGTDRFGINSQKNIFGCRKECGPYCKGDQVALVQHVMGMEFLPALEWLCGSAYGLSEAEREARRLKAAEARRRQDEYARNARKHAVARARAIWQDALPAEGTVVREYLARRGIPLHLMPAMPATIRFQPAMPYTIPNPERRGQWQTIFTGPCMIAAVTDGRFNVTAVHRTWIDLREPSGKRVIQDPKKTGEFLPAKKVLGSKKGGAIRLRTPRREGLNTLIMGEGVETTLSAMIVADDPFGAAYWAGVDLGNMSGRQARVEGKRYSGMPDLDDGDAFLPPRWVRRLIFIQDGDSDPAATTAKLQAGLRRAMALRSGVAGFVVHAGVGRDLNDLLRGSDV